MPTQSSDAPNRMCTNGRAHYRALYKKISAINVHEFSADILSSTLHTNPATTVSSFTEYFHSVLSSILDKHAPSKTITCRSRPTKPFITPEIRTEKSKRSQLEIRSRQTQSIKDDSMFKAQANKVKRMVTSAKQSYYRGLISSHHDNIKKLWNSLDSLLGRNSPQSLPSSSSPSTLATFTPKFFQ